MIIYSTVRFSSSAKITICLVLFLSVILFEAVFCGEARCPSIEHLLLDAAWVRRTVTWKSPHFTLDPVLSGSGAR